MRPAPRPSAVPLALALLAAAAFPALGAGEDKAVGRPYKPNPRVTLERFRLPLLKPLTAMKAEKVVEGEARDNLPLERTAASWDDVGFTLDPAAPPASATGDFTGEVRAVPVNLGLGFVRPLQKALAKAGYYKTGFLQDGYFGVYTSSELARFQRAQGLAATGWADRPTVERLNAAAGTSLDASAGEEFAKAVKGSLKYLGYYGGAVDGIFDAGVKRAVTDFQVKQGVKSGGMYGGSFKIVRGWVDKATAERINEMVREKKGGE